MKNIDRSRVLQILVFEDESRLKKVIKRLQKSPKREFLDYHLPDDVGVWEKLELSLTVEEFLEQVETGRQQYDLPIDFAQLKEQKLVLIDMIEDWSRSNDVLQNSGADLVGGILTLLDTIQDQAVEKGYATEEEAFNITED